MSIHLRNDLFGFSHTFPILPSTRDCVKIGVPRSHPLRKNLQGIRISHRLLTWNENQRSFLPACLNKQADEPAVPYLKASC